MSASVIERETVSSDKRPVLWRPTPKQSEFLAAPQREVLFGGALGAGKTDALLMAAASQSGNRHHRAIIFRRSFPMLRDLISRSHELFIPLGATFNVQTSTWTFPSGAKIEFGFLDSPFDRHRYVGRQFDFLGFDELTSWEADSEDASGEPVNGSYIFLFSRLRAVEGSGLRLEVRSTCTPNGPGVHWVKARFGIGDDGGPSMVKDPVTGYHRRFIPGRILDNPFLRGGEYAKQLEALPTASHAALVEGRWDSVEGSMFDSWRREKDGKPWHVCEPFPIPVDWDLWRGVDDGFAAPFACYWLTKDPNSGTIYVIDEIYATKLLATEVAERVKEKDLSIKLTDQRGSFGLNKRILEGMLDSAAFSDTGQAVITRGDQMNALGCKWIAVEKFPGSRIARIRNFHQLLAPNPMSPGSQPSTPGIVFFSVCKHAIRTIPALQRSERDSEDIDDAGEIHAFDGVTYGLQYEKPISKRVRLGGI